MATCEEFQNPNVNPINAKTNGTVNSLDNNINESFPTNNLNYSDVDDTTNCGVSDGNIHRQSTPKTLQRLSHISNSSSGVGTSDNTSNIDSEDTNTSDVSHTDCMSESLSYNVPILGYEVMEERTRFTVFKIRVEHQPTGKTWFVFRRYTDFVRLNKKLRVLFRGLRLILPPKRWFGNNFDPIFLEDRLLGLQAYITNILKHKEISQSKLVMDFFCLDDPPDPHDSIEESRALCEDLEENVHRLRCQLKEKDNEIDYLCAEIAMLKTQLSSLVQSLKLECALTSYTQSQSYKNLSQDEDEKKSSQIYHLHSMNLAIAQMIENSLSSTNEQNNGIEVGLDATILCSESYPSCSNFLNQQIFETSYGNERTVGDGSTGVEERPTPLGGTDDSVVEVLNSDATAQDKSIHQIEKDPIDLSKEVIKQSAQNSDCCTILAKQKCVVEIIKPKLSQTINCQPMCTS